MIARRTMFAGGAALVAAPWSAAAQTPLVGLQDIIARRGQAALLGAERPSAEIWSFADGAGPLIIHARQGEELALRLVNTLEVDIWLHWFGVRGPSAEMTIQVPPGEANAVTCRFTPPDAGTYWLGPMADVSRLRDMGLYAMVVVAERQPLAGLADVALVLDDWQLTDAGTVQGGFGDVEAMAGEGRLGNWFTVNGAYRPRLGLAAGKVVRLRLLNAANVRTMSLLFKGADPLLVALDGQPVRPRSIGRTAFTLAPGQRADLLVFPEAEIVLALDLFEDISEIAYLAREGNGPVPGLPDNFALPANPLAQLSDLAVARRVPLRIDGGIKGGLKSARFRGQDLGLRDLLERGMGWAFNGVAGPGGDPLVDARLGETIIFEVDNRTAFDQPLHIHGHVWSVIDGDQPPPVWRDTAIAPAKGSLRLAMVADNPGSWALHSLIAERADGGLLTSFTVAGPGAL